MLFISLDKKVCLSEPKLNSVNLVAKAVVLENRQKTGNIMIVVLPEGQ